MTSTLTTADSLARKLASLWGEVLGIDDISMTVPFTEYGGSSLAATRMVLFARRRLGLDLSVREVLAGATIADLVADGRDAHTTLAKETSVNDSREFRATPPQQWILARGRRSFVNGVGIVDGPLSRGSLERAVRDVAGAHDALRTRFHEKADGWWGRVDDTITPGVRWLEAVDVSSASATMRAAFADFVGDTEPVRVCAVWTPKGTLIGLFAEHSALDGDSIPLFFSELARAYRGEPLTGAGQELAELSARYRRAARPAALAYWGEVLGALGPYPAVAIPGVHSVAGVRDAKTVSLPLDQTLVADFRLACRAARLTEFAGALACLAVALDRLGVPDERLGVNTASAGRFWSDTEETIGNFAHEITLDLGPRTDSLSEAFTQVRVGLATAMRHDTVHRRDLLERVIPEVDPQERPDRCLWVTAESEWAIDGADFGPAGVLRSLAPMPSESPVIRPYPGLGLTVATGRVAHLTCDYSYVDFDDVSAQNLLTQWRGAVSDAAAAARNGGLR